MSDLTGHVRYAFNRSQGASSNGKYHLVLDQPLHAGRLNREKGDALCKPRSKFWGLDRGSPRAVVDCPVCLQRAQQHGISVAR
jgi:hypothetical protein